MSNVEVNADVLITEKIYDHSIEIKVDGFEKKFDKGVVVKRMVIIQQICCVNT